MKKVCIQGLGFVGSAMSIAVALANDENGPKFDVVGVDLPTKNGNERVKSINSGVFPIEASDPKIKEYYDNARKRENFLASYDPKVYQFADTIIVDINLDVQKESNLNRELQSFNVDLNPFKSAIKTIGENCKENALILVETTVPPGTCIKVVKPIIYEELRKRKLDTSKITIGHSYERVMPGPNYIDSIRNQDIWEKVKGQWRLKYELK